MEIRLKGKYTDKEITIATNTNDPDAAVTPRYSGQDVDIFKKELGESYGIYGHIINPEQTTNADLRAACNKLPNWYLLSATPVIAAPKLPEGVTT